MPQISLRPATQDDHDFLWWLHRNTIRPSVEATWGWDEAWQLQYFKERYAPTRGQIVENAGEPIGYLVVERREASLFLALLEIAPAFQNQGIGTRLIADLVEEGRSLGLPVELHVLKANRSAQRLYERLGFVITEDREERFVMRCDVTERP